MRRKQERKSGRLKRIVSACLAATLASAMCVPATALADDTTLIGPTDQLSGEQEVLVTMSKSCYWAVQIPRKIQVSPNSSTATNVTAFGDVGASDIVSVSLQGKEKDGSWVDLNEGDSLYMSSTFVTVAGTVVRESSATATFNDQTSMAKWTADELAADSFAGTQKQYVTLTGPSELQTGNYSGYVKYIVNYNKVDTVNFSINGLPYEADEGATWEKWVDSDKNTIGVTFENGKVMLGDEPICASDGSAVSSTATVNNDKYTCENQSIKINDGTNGYWLYTPATVSRWKDATLDYTSSNPDVASLSIVNDMMVLTMADKSSSYIMNSEKNVYSADTISPYGTSVTYTLAQKDISFTLNGTTIAASKDASWKELNSVIGVGTTTIDGVECAALGESAIYLKGSSTAVALNEKPEANATYTCEEDSLFWYTSLAENGKWNYVKAGQTWAEAISSGLTTLEDSLGKSEELSAADDGKVYLGKDGSYVINDLTKSAVSKDSKIGVGISYTSGC